ncbi:MAG: ECF-type sigma factor, partial [Phycisphaerales bacterium]
MSSELTSILQAIDRGDAQAAADLLPLLYDELRRLAESRMANESPEHTLQATALVHEAYLRVIGPDHNDEARWQSRAHFFAAAAEAMRRILVDHARAKGARKRGGDARRLTLDPNLFTLADTPPEILDLHEAVEKLDAEDPLK